MKLLVAGSRTWTDREAVRSYLEIANPDHLVVGDCPTGADAIAWEWAKERRIQRGRHYALWDLQGKAAGPLRNRRMLQFDRPDLVVVFRSLGPSPGSDDMIAQAQKFGVPLEVIREAPVRLRPASRSGVPPTTTFSAPPGHGNRKSKSAR